MKFKLGELFCGPGGMALGAKMAAEEFVAEYGGDTPINHIWGVDYDENAIGTYSHPDNGLGEGVCCDALRFATDQQDETGDSKHKTLKNFRGSKLPEKDKKINALAFGFPCNDFSMVGKRRGTEGKFGQLYTAGVEVLKRRQPDWFVAENVSGIHSANDGAAFATILNELRKTGYVLTVHLYKFEDYGVPQYRHRYIIVGIKKNAKDINGKPVEFLTPKPTHAPKKGKEFEKYVSAKDVLKKPYDDVPEDEAKDPNHPVRIKTRQSKEVKERLFFTPPWRNAWFVQDLLDLSPDERKTKLIKAKWLEKEFNNEPPLSDDEIVRRVKKCTLNCSRAKMSHIYKRLDAKRPAYTVTGSGGGGTHVYHWEKPRALTNRERARLQSFPDSFNFVGKKEKVRKQIGMAVPPDGAKAIFLAILKTFSGIEYAGIPPNYPPEKRK